MIVPHQKAHPKTLENSGSSTVHAVDAVRQLHKDETKDKMVPVIVFVYRLVRLYTSYSAVCVYIFSTREVM